MDINELQKYLEKIDFNALSKDNVKLSEDDAYVGELYNSAIDNIKQYNIDVAKIKLSRVVKLDPTFEKAKLLLDRINTLENDKSLGEKIEEALDKKDDKDNYKDKKTFREHESVSKLSFKEILQSIINRFSANKKQTFPVKRKVRMNPLTFIKMQMVIIIVLIVIIVILIAIILYLKNKHEDYVAAQPDLKTEITQLTQDKYEQSELYQSAVLQYEDRIKKLEDSLNPLVRFTCIKTGDRYLIQQNKLYMPNIFL